MYGGSGIWPSLSRISSKIPSYSNWIRRFPSSTTSMTLPFKRPSPKETSAPTFIFFPGFTSVSQTLSDFLFKSRTSIPASVPILCPMRRAGITFVSLMTRQSPFFRYCKISRKWRCSISPVFLSNTSSLEAERSSSGSCAISSGGSSKLKSVTFMFCISCFISLSKVPGHCSRIRGKNQCGAPED